MYNSQTYTETVSLNNFSSILDETSGESGNPRDVLKILLLVLDDSHTFTPIIWIP